MTISADRLKDQDSKAWNAFYDLYQDAVYGFVYRLVRGDRSVADDLFQEVWLAAMESIQTYDADRGDVASWLFGIARRRVALHWRQTLVGARQHEFIEHSPIEEQSDETLLPLAAMELIEREEIVNAALLVMPHDQRHVLHCKYVEGLAVAEIADRASRSPKAIESLLSRAREKLKRLLGPVFDDAVRTVTKAVNGRD